MSQLAEALSRITVALKMSHQMINRCPWWKVRTRWHLQGAHDMLEATYDMLYSLTLEAAAIKAREDKANEQSN